MAKEGTMKYFVRKPPGSDHCAFLQTEDGRKGTAWVSRRGKTRAFGLMFVFRGQRCEKGLDHAWRVLWVEILKIILGWLREEGDVKP
jgi:hypothetical protein